jgi:hypothetical protein
MMKSQVRLSVLLVLLVAVTRLGSAQSSGDEKIVFVCEHGAAKSVIATAYFNKLAAERGLRIALPTAAPIRGGTVGVGAEGAARDGWRCPVPSAITTGDVTKATHIFAIGCSLPAHASASGAESRRAGGSGYAAQRDAIKNTLNGCSINCRNARGESP